VVGDASSTLWLLLAAVGVVLFVAAANVGLLSLIRGLDRREDTAVRLALGANAGRLVREYMWESALLASIGGALGLAIAVVGLRLIPALTPDLPRLNEAAFDHRAVLFIVVVAAFAGVIAGLPQAWRHIRMSPRVGLASGALRTTEGTSAHRFRDAVVVIQIALAAVLMIGSGLLTRSFLRLRAADPGFDARGVLVVPIFLDTQAYSTGAKVRTYYRTLFSRLSALPGVVAVGGATTVPTSPLGPDFDRPVWPAGTAPDVAARTPAAVRIVTPGYVEALGLRVVAGRAIDDRDSPQAPRVIMVSESLARRMWPGRAAVGQRLVVDYSTSGVYPYEVVGVVRDVKFHGPRSEPALDIYLAHAQRSYLILNVVVKTAGDPRASIGRVRAVLKSVDPQKPAQGLYPLEDLMGATYARDRQVMFVLLAFASTVAFLALLAMYGALSQRVRERSREIGIRVALGARPWTVVGWIAAPGGRLFAIGLASGVVATRMVGGALNGMLFGVAPTDPTTILVAAGVLALIGGFATFVPAWRASLVDPVCVLRRG
jgi:predicted permease